MRSTRPLDQDKCSEQPSGIVSDAGFTPVLRLSWRSRQQRKRRSAHRCLLRRGGATSSPSSARRIASTFTAGPRRTQISDKLKHADERFALELACRDRIMTAQSPAPHTTTAGHRSSLSATFDAYVRRSDLVCLLWPCDLRRYVDVSHAIDSLNNLKNMGDGL